MRRHPTIRPSPRLSNNGGVTVEAIRSGIDLSYVDPGARPQDDLFGHVNGRWLADHRMPADRATDGAFRLLADRAEEQVRDIITEAAAANAAEDTDPQRIGDLYASFMDTETIAGLGVRPLLDELAGVDAALTPTQLAAELGELQRTGIGGGTGVYVDTDAKDSTRYLLHMSQSGLGLPDESYYRDPQHAAILAEYPNHIARMFALVYGEQEADWDATAAQIVALETKIAAAHWDVVKRRDADLTYNLRTFDELRSEATGFDWAVWLHALGAFDRSGRRGRRRPARRADRVRRAVGERGPRGLEALAALARDQRARVDADRRSGRRELRVLRSHAVGHRADARPLEARCRAGREPDGRRGRPSSTSSGTSRRSQGADGRAGGQPARGVPRQHHRLEWMTPETRQRALEKLDKFTPKIGYPAKWRDYSTLDDRPRRPVRQLPPRLCAGVRPRSGQARQPVDRDEWFMTPQTVNAYYNPGMNEIVFPAAILQPPFFDAEADDAANYGGIGAVIGHEIGHGFDDQGAKYDGDGNLVDWWTDDDRAEFGLRTKALIEQYDVYTPRGLENGHHVNGAFTVGENIGDLGGLSIALLAYQLSLTARRRPSSTG